MTITNKIKGAMHLKGVSIAQLAEKLGIQPTALSSKFYRGNYSAKDLIIIAETLGFELCFIDENTKITFDRSNIPAPKKKA